ncbi:uncharacterized protein [Temnothorax longispinosus]|uniref:uncharacterized protein n=1 Tax=Temnothorax longispinosus TaxID=300112 RepID=UPI003A9999CF
MENDHSLTKKRYRGYLTSLNPVLPRSTRLRLEQQEQNRQNFQEVANNIQPQEDRQYILNAGCEQNCNQHDEREHDGDESDGMEDGHISSVHEQPQEVFLTNEMNKDVSDSDNDLQKSSSYPISSAESSVDDSNSSAESSVDDSNSDEEYNGSNLQQNPDLQRKFKDGFATTKFECMLMILTFSLRQSLSTVAMQDLCKLINCLFEEDVIPTSEYWFKKTFGSNLPYRVHLYCSDCEAYIG